MVKPRYPSLYEVNTRVWLTELSRPLGRAATLDDVPDAELDRWAELGFDWIWLLSVWQTGLAARQVSRSNPDWRREYRDTLPDLREEDVGGSGFAVVGYSVHPSLGGDDALARLRERMRRRGLRLMLDFMPNHVGLDHPWIEEHPDYFIHSSEIDLSNAPRNYVRVKSTRGDLILAYGRDPYFAGWPDTLQLDYANPATQEAMIGELTKIAQQCDGLRCDMAMLILPTIFERTWGRQAAPFWPKAIERVREKVTDFLFLAEVYWDLEWTLLQQGFDYAYDKQLYDRLRRGQARPVREHLGADLSYQNKLVRFLENHDEPRAATAFPLAMHKAAAVITFLAPGMRFVHQGECEGRKKRISPHLVRGPQEPLDPDLRQFYACLLNVLRQPLVRGGDWQLLGVHPSAQGNASSENVLAFAWQGASAERLFVAANFSANKSQCHVRLPFADLRGASWRLQDQMGDAVYDRDGDELTSGGMYLDMAAWQYHVFTVSRLR